MVEDTTEVMTGIAREIATERGKGKGIGTGMRPAIAIATTIATVAKNEREIGIGTENESGIENGSMIWSGRWIAPAISYAMLPRAQPRAVHNYPQSLRHHSRRKFAQGW